MGRMGLMGFQIQSGSSFPNPIGLISPISPMNSPKMTREGQENPNPPSPIESQQIEPVSHGLTGRN